MPISDLGDPHGRWLVDLLDDALGDPGWEVATAQAGRFPIFSSWADRFSLAFGGPGLLPANDKVRQLIEPLQKDEVYVEAVDTRTHEWKRLPAPFWLGGYLLKPGACGDRGTGSFLQPRSDSPGEAPAVYLNPRLMIPQTGTPQRLAWQFAEEILKGSNAPPRGHRRLITLARMVHPRLKAAGHDLIVDTIASYIGKSLRDWEGKHPGR